MRERREIDRDASLSVLPARALRHFAALGRQPVCAAVYLLAMLLFRCDGKVLYALSANYMTINGYAPAFYRRNIEVTGRHCRQSKQSPIHCCGSPVRAVDYFTNISRVAEASQP